MREALAGQISGDGPIGRRVEARLAGQLGASRVLLTTSGTHALELALLALGIGPGQEVVCPSFTFVSSANAVLRVGARPVFADIEEDTLGLDPADVERRLTPRTSALLPVHYAGVAPDMEALLGHRPPPRPARGRRRRPGAGRHLAGTRPRNARRRRVPQLPRDQEHHLRRGRRPGGGRPRDRAPGRDRAREGHEPRRLLPRGGGQVHLGGGRLELRALGRARRDPRRPARQAREDPGASGGGREALPRGPRGLGGRARRAPGARAAGARAEPPHLLPPLPGGAAARRGAALAAGAGDPGDVPLRAPALGSPRPQARPGRRRCR